MNMPDKNTLTDLLSYHKETGSLIWKRRSVDMFNCLRTCNAWNARYSGKEAGTLNKAGGYLYVGINGTQYLAHRIIWMMLNGFIPEGMQIDHINHKRNDNRECNLRLVTPRENRMNSSRMSTNTSGVSGVDWQKREMKWRARIKINRNELTIGYFSNKESAIAARKNAEKKYGFHENHGVAQ